MQQVTVKINLVNSLKLRLKRAARLPLINLTHFKKCLGNEILP